MSLVIVQKQQQYVTTLNRYSVNAIFYVKYSRDIEILARGRSRSLKMAPIDRSHTTSNWSAIITIGLALSFTRFELFDVGVNNTVTFKDRSEATEGHW